MYCVLQELALGSTGSRLARRKALGMGAAGFEGRRRRRALGPVVGGMAEDGSYVGPGGGEVVLQPEATRVWVHNQRGHYVLCFALDCVVGQAVCSAWVSLYKCTTLLQCT